MMERDQSRQEELSGRFRGALIELGCVVPLDTSELVVEMIDANEAPLALEILSEVLEERGELIDERVGSSLADLARTYFLGPEVESRLLGLCRPLADG